MNWGWQDVLSEVGEVGGAFRLEVAGFLVRGRGRMAFGLEVVGLVVRMNEQNNLILIYNIMY